MFSGNNGIINVSNARKTLESRGFIRHPLTAITEKPSISIQENSYPLITGGKHAEMPVEMPAEDWRLHNGIID